jgi:hypothetical protein
MIHKGKNNNRMNQMSKLDAFIQQAVTAMPISGTSLLPRCMATLYYNAVGKCGWAASRRCWKD